LSFLYLLKARKNWTKKSISLDLEGLTANLISLNWIKAKNVQHNPLSLIFLIKDLRKKGPKCLLEKKPLVVVGGQRKMVLAKIRAFALVITVLYAMTTGRRIMLPFRKSVTCLSTRVHLAQKLG